MAEELKFGYPNETGGILLGYFTSDGIDAVVIKVIGPGPNAKHHPYAFWPDGDYHQEQIEIEYERSQREHTYLGDWHVHLNGGDSLSPVDKRTLKKIAKEPMARAPNPLMGILTGPTVGELTPWKWVPRQVASFHVGWRAIRMDLVLY